MDSKPLYSTVHPQKDKPPLWKRILQWFGFFRPSFSEDSIEEIIFIDKKGEDYVRDMYDDSGNWIGIEIQKFVTKEEAEKWYGTKGTS